MSPQKGNVTLISALAMCLIMLTVLLASSLSTTGSTANKIQAASDDAAVTAAASYIGVVNDQVLLDTISWGLGFVDRLLDILDVIGGVIAAIPFLEGLGAAISAVAELLQGVVEDLRQVFDDVIRQPLEDILDQAKSYLGLVNATIAAANNGYLGFILPDGSLKDGIKSATETQYDLDYVKRRVAHSLKLVDTGGYRSGLAGAIQEISIQQVWGKAPDVPAPQNAPPPCPDPKGCPPLKESRLGLNPNGSFVDTNRDTFHLWPTTPTCVDPPYDPTVNPYAVKDQAAAKALQPSGNQWSRPCNEYLWLQKLVQAYYWKEWKSLEDLWNLLFASPGCPANQSCGNPPKGTFMANKGPFLERSPGDAAKADQLIRDAQGKLTQTALGGGGGQVGRYDPNVKVDNCDSPTQNITFMAWAAAGCLDAWRADACLVNDPNPVFRPKLGPYYSFKCSGTRRSDAVEDYINGNVVKRCPTDPAGPACQAFWGMDAANFGKFVTVTPPTLEWPDYIVVGQPLKAGQSTEYRLSKTRSQEERAATSLLSAWKAETFDCSNLADGADRTGCPVAGAEANGDAEEDFIMVGDVTPDSATALIARLAGRSIPSDRWSITGSKVKVFKAKAKADKVHVRNLCSRIFKVDNPNDPSDFPKALGIFPYTPYGICYTILESFDALASLRASIQSIFDPVIHFVKDDLCFLGVCPFDFIGDWLQGLIDFVLGPQAPDARTFHIALGTVGCIPQLETAAKLANTHDLIAAVTAVKDASGESGSGSCP